jgi:hypothetical protein
MNIIEFPGRGRRKRQRPAVATTKVEGEFRSRPYTRRDGNMHTFAFRSLTAIMEADDTDLIRDICCDPHKAQVKLKRISNRIEGIRQQSAEQIEQLTAAETKLRGAIVAALLTSKESLRRWPKSLPVDATRPCLQATSADDVNESGHQRAGRSKNPLRQHYNRAYAAVIIAGKLHRGEPLQREERYDELDHLRKGAAAARILADELALIVESLPALNAAADRYGSARERGS